MFTDDCHRVRWLYTFKEKGQAYHELIKFSNLVKTQYERYPRAFRMDNGTEYGGKAFQKFAQDNGIAIEPTVPYTPEQDGVAERSNRTILERTRSMIVAMDDGILKQLWPKLIKTTAYLTNHIATRN